MSRNFWLTSNPYMGTFANSGDSDETLHKAAIHEGLHRLLRQNQPTETEIKYVFEFITSDPSIYTINHPDLTLTSWKSPLVLNKLRYSKQCSPQDFVESHLALHCLLMFHLGEDMHIMGLVATKQVFRGFISAFVIRILESIISKLASSESSIF